MKKYLIAASALAIGLSMASGALADSEANNNDNNDGSFVGNSSNDGNDNNDVDFLSGNSSNDGDDNNDVDLLSGNSSNDGDDDNDVDVLSGNSDDDNNGNNRNNIVDSGNVDVDVDVGIEIDVDNSINDSVVAEQDLIATTIDTDVVFDDATLQLLDGGNDFNTGEITQNDDAFRGFTGIATIAMDTSVGSNNQAATQVAAGADIIFE